jgi:hypothetical protein
MRPARAVAAIALVAAIASVISATPAAGARDGVAIGVFQPGAPERPGLIDAFARQIGRRPALVESFFSWDEQLISSEQLHAVASRGAVPLVTWEPWHASLESIRAGKHDDYIRASARDAAAYGGPIMLRFAPEMNGSWAPWGAGVDGNTPADYVGAWRHIVSIFRKEGATNVRWVWAPNIMASDGGQRFNPFYPGDRWVDWVALDGYNWGADLGWRSFTDVFGPSYETLTRLSPKPVMIAETGCNQTGGDKAAWITSAFGREIPQFKRLRAVVWFNATHAGGKEDWRVDSSPQSLRAFRTAVGAPRYDVTGEQLLHVRSTGPRDTSVSAPSSGFGAPSVFERFRNELRRGSALAWAIVGVGVVIALVVVLLAARVLRRRRARRSPA